MKKIFFYFFLDPKNGQIGHIHLAHLSHSSKIFIMCTESSHLHFLEILNTPSWNFLHIHMNYMHNMQLKYLIWLLHARIEKLKKIHLKILRIYLKKLIYKFNKVTWYMHNCTYPETSKNKEPRNKKYPSKTQTKRFDKSSFRNFCFRQFSFRKFKIMTKSTPVIKHFDDSERFRGPWTNVIDPYRFSIFSFSIFSFSAFSFSIITLALHI